jgi:hypothetical protein
LSSLQNLFNHLTSKLGAAAEVDSPFFTRAFQSALIALASAAANRYCLRQAASAVLLHAHDGFRRLSAGKPAEEGLLHQPLLLEHRHDKARQRPT